MNRVIFGSHTFGPTSKCTLCPTCCLAIRVYAIVYTYIYILRVCAFRIQNAPCFWYVDCVNVCIMHLAYALLTARERFLCFLRAIHRRHMLVLNIHIYWKSGEFHEPWMFDVLYKEAGSAGFLVWVYVYIVSWWYHMPDMCVWVCAYCVWWLEIYWIFPTQERMPAW